MTRTTDIGLKLLAITTLVNSSYMRLFPGSWNYSIFRDLLNKLVMGTAISLASHLPVDKTFHTYITGNHKHYWLSWSVHDVHETVRVTSNHTNLAMVPNFVSIITSSCAH